jgi:hypothetical protein
MMSLKRSVQVAETKVNDAKCAKVEQKGYIIGVVEVENTKFCEEENQVLIITSDKKRYRGVVKDLDVFPTGSEVTFSAGNQKIEIFDRVAANVSEIKKVENGEAKSFKEIVELCDFKKSFFDVDGKTCDFLESLVVFCGSGVELKTEKNKIFHKLTMYSCDSSESIQITIFGDKSLTPGLKVVHNFAVAEDSWEKKGSKMSKKEKSVLVVSLKGAKLEREPHVRYVERNLSTIPVEAKSLTDLKNAADKAIAKNADKAKQTFECQKIQVEIKSLKVRFEEETGEAYGLAISKQKQKIVLKTKAFAKVLAAKNLKIPKSFKEFKKEKNMIEKAFENSIVSGSFNMFYFKRAPFFVLSNYLE